MALSPLATYVHLLSPRNRLDNLPYQGGVFGSLMGTPIINLPQTGNFTISPLYCPPLLTCA